MWTIALQSACQSPHIQDFIEVPTPISRKIKGFTGKTTSTVHIGTIRWDIEDDQGAVHQLMYQKDPQGYYPLNIGHMLLRITNQSPGTNVNTNKTIPLDIQDTNVATIDTAQAIQVLVTRMVTKPSTPAIQTL